MSTIIQLGHKESFAVCVEGVSMARKEEAQHEALLRYPANEVFEISL